jgi:hypothetical protein
MILDKNIKIENEEHYKNIKELPFVDLSKYLDEKYKLTVSPYDDYKSDSRYIILYLKNKFRINPTLLIEDFLNDKIPIICDICKNNIRKNIHFYRNNKDTVCILSLIHI